jgi:uncharacterized membrane protein YecN with MAPEG domain
VNLRKDHYRMMEVLGLSLTFERVVHASVLSHIIHLTPFVHHRVGTPFWLVLRGVFTFL